MKVQLRSFGLGFIAALGFFSVAASAQQAHIIVADSSSSGTYQAMLAQIKAVCDGDDFVINEAPQKGGATDNLEALVNNRVSAAFMHSDVIFAAAQADPSYKKLKTLIALYPEEIHVLVLRESKTTTGGWKGIGATTVEFNTLGDLANFSVGAAGGGVITARILTGQGEVHYNVTVFDKGNEVIAALRSGQIQAAIFVGGSPLPNIEQLNGDEFKLIPIGEAIANRVQGVYRKAVINYSNLKSGPINTLAPTAILLTRTYTIPKLVAPQAHLRQCFLDHLERSCSRPPACTPQVAARRSS